MSLFLSTPHAISFVIFIISLIAFITTRTFGGITKAIEVLEGLTKGDHTQEMPVRKGILASEKDEVGQLSAALYALCDAGCCMAMLWLA